MCTLFSASCTLLKYSSWIFLCAIGLSILCGPSQRGRLHHCLTHTCFSIVSPTARTMCIPASFTQYACIHLAQPITRRQIPYLCCYIVSDLIIMLQLSVVTSCNQFFHLSISLSEFDVQKPSRSHEIHPSTVEFTQSFSRVVIM